jgi:hypothetical protein
VTTPVPPPQPVATTATRAVARAVRSRRAIAGGV